MTPQQQLDAALLFSQDRNPGAAHPRPVGGALCQPARHRAEDPDQDRPGRRLLLDMAPAAADQRGPGSLFLSVLRAAPSPGTSPRRSERPPHQDPLDNPHPRGKCRGSGQPPPLLAGRGSPDLPHSKIAKRTAPASREAPPFCWGTAISPGDTPPAPSFPVHWWRGPRRPPRRRG